MSCSTSWSLNLPPTLDPAYMCQFSWNSRHVACYRLRLHPLELPVATADTLSSRRILEQVGWQFWWCARMLAKAPGLLMWRELRIPGISGIQILWAQLRYSNGMSVRHSHCSHYLLRIYENIFFHLKLRISISTELIKFLILGKLQISQWMVLGYIILRFLAFLSLLFTYSLENRGLRC